MYAGLSLYAMYPCLSEALCNPQISQICETKLVARSSSCIFTGSFFLFARKSKWTKEVDHQILCENIFYVLMSVGKDLPVAKYCGHQQANRANRPKAHYTKCARNMETNQVTRDIFMILLLVKASCFHLHLLLNGKHCFLPKLSFFIAINVDVTLKLLYSKQFIYSMLTKQVKCTCYTLVQAHLLVSC